MTSTDQARPAQRRLVIAVALLAAFVLALGWRLFETAAVGTGETKASPDGRYVASVMDFSDRAFFSGEPRRWFRFQVSGPDFNREIEGPPLPGPYFGSRSSTSVIRWEPDSSVVRFVFPSSEVRIETRATTTR